MIVHHCSLGSPYYYLLAKCPINHQPLLLTLLWWMIIVTSFSLVFPFIWDLWNNQPSDHWPLLLLGLLQQMIVCRFSLASPSCFSTCWAPNQLLAFAPCLAVMNDCCNKLLLSFSLFFRQTDWPTNPLIVGLCSSLACCGKWLSTTAPWLLLILFYLPNAQAIVSLCSLPCCNKQFSQQASPWLFLLFGTCQTTNPLIIGHCYSSAYLAAEKETLCFWMTWRSSM